MTPISRPFGEPILWIIGVDEKARTIVGANKNELASWHPRVVAEFNELAPYMTDLNIPYNGQTIVALIFNTERAPFVVKNPVFGSPGNGPVSLEVPWREGTATRSATRADLLRLLTPLERLPIVTVLNMRLLANNHSAGVLTWRLEAVIYIASKVKEEIIIPFHLCFATAEIGGQLQQVTFNRVFLHSHPRAGVGERGSQTIRYSQTEILVAGAGMAFFGGDASTDDSKFEGHSTDTAHVTISLVQTHDSRRIVLNHSVSATGPSQPGRWGTWGVSTDVPI